MEMKNFAVDQATFMAWAGPGQLRLDKSVVFELDASGQPKKSLLRKVLDTLDSGEVVDLLDRDAKIVAHVEFTKDGYVGTWL